MPSFALPMALWALAALVLPVLLHLARRERQQRTVFAALAWLDPRPRPRRRLRLEEWLLLALRLALLAALALWLAIPLWRAPAPASVLLVHPALPAPAGAPAEGEQRRWLAPGFPDATTPAPAPDVPVASLLREFDAGLDAGAALAIRLPADTRGWDAAPVRLSRAVDWQVVDGPATEATATADAKPPALALRGDANDASQRWLRAVHAAWQSGAETPLPLDAGAPDAAPPGRDTVVAWTGADAPGDALLAWVREGGTLLLDAAAPWPLPPEPIALDAGGWLQGAGHGRGRVLKWRVPLTPAALPALAEADFPARLQALLWPAPTPTRADARAMAPATGAAPPAPPSSPRDPPLAWLVLVLFALERAWALRRGAGSAA